MLCVERWQGEKKSEIRLFHFFFFPKFYYQPLYRLQNAAMTHALSKHPFVKASGMPHNLYPHLSLNISNPCLISLAKKPAWHRKDEENNSSSVKCSFITSAMLFLLSLIRTFEIWSDSFRNNRSHLTDFREIAAVPEAVWLFVSVLPLPYRTLETVSFAKILCIPDKKNHQSGNWNPMKR